MNAVVQTNVTEVKKPDFNAIEKVGGEIAFPEVFAKGEVGQVIRRVNRHPDCIASNPDYVPDEKTLRRALAWWHTPMRMAFGLHGETGTGKTELLLYIADRLNEPVYMVKVHPALMPEDLEGCKELVNDDKGVVTKNTLGPAAKAYAFGGLIILDEVDKTNAALGCALHGLVEGKPWPVEQFSLTINRHPMCRVTGTANTTGQGGHERYHTSGRMDLALRSRFGWMQTHFPTPAREMAILEKKFGQMLPRAMLKACVDVANGFRDAVLGAADQHGKRPGLDNPEINAVFSTRTLVNWCNYTIAYGPTATWQEAFDFAFDGSLDPECKREAEAITQRILGGKLDMNVKDVVESYKLGK